MRRASWRRVAMLAMALVGASAGAQALPPAVAALVAPAPRSASTGPVELLFDASLSMAGYARSPNPQRRPLGDVIAVVREHAAVTGATLSARAFGSRLAPAAGDLNAWGTPAPYECGRAKGCDNLESRIDLALGAIRAARADTLSVLVSDLWLDNSAFAGSATVALGQPLRGILSTGRTVAVVGLRAPFSGVVYGMPGVGDYRGAAERALFLVIAGPERRVSDLLRALRESGSASFAPATMRVARFQSPTRPIRVAPPIAVGAGVTALPAASGVGRYAIDWSDAARGAPMGRLVGRYDLARALPADSVWRGDSATSTRLWRFTGGAWRPFPSPGETWRADGVGKASFALAPKLLGKLPAGRYLLLGGLGTRAVAQPDPAARWMREWSLADNPGPNPGKPKFVGALGLSQLAAVLETAVSVDAPRIAFAAQLEIED